MKLGLTIVVIGFALFFCWGVAHFIALDQTAFSIAGVGISYALLAFVAGCGICYRLVKR